MIGTNNSNKNKDGTDTYTEADILEGVTAIVNQIRARQPDAKVLLLAIFPRAKTFQPATRQNFAGNQRGARPAWMTGKHVFYLDIGPQFIENDGSISTGHDARRAASR